MATRANNEILMNIINSNDPRVIINFFRERKVISDEPPVCTNLKCHQKNKTMYFGKRDTVDGWSWRCSSYGTYKSIRAGSFLSLFQTSLTKLIRMMFNWAMQYRQTDIMEIVGVSQQTITTFNQYMRYVAHKVYDRDNIRFGGPGHVVEIDESLFIRVKQLAKIYTVLKFGYLVFMTEKLNVLCFKLCHVTILTILSKIFYEIYI